MHVVFRTTRGARLGRATIKCYVFKSELVGLNDLFRESAATWFSLKISTQKAEAFGPNDRFLPAWQSRELAESAAPSIMQTRLHFLGVTETHLLASAARG